MATPKQPVFEGMILAAGQSRRAGVLKAAVEIRGVPLVRHAVASLQVRCRRVVVVVGHEHGRIEELLAGLEGVVTVFNPRFAEDMFHSVRCGAAAVTADAAGFFMLPVDCPFVAPDVLDTLITAFDAAEGRHPVVPVHDGRGGHPLLLPASAREVIIAAAPPTTLRDVQARLGARRVTVTSSAVLADADTPEDLDRLARDHGEP